MWRGPLTEFPCFHRCFGFRFCVVVLFSYVLRHLLQVSPPHSPAAAGTFSSRRRHFGFPSGSIRSSVALWPVSFRAAAPRGTDRFYPEMRAKQLQRRKNSDAVAVFNPLPNQNPGKSSSWPFGRSRALRRSSWRGPPRGPPPVAWGRRRPGSCGRSCRWGRSCPRCRG